MFSTWCAKVLGLIGMLPDTLASRSIAVCLRRKGATDKVETLPLEAHGLFTDLQSQAARWAADNEKRLNGARPKLPEELLGRAADNWKSLLAIADAAGGVWPERARRAAVMMVKNRKLSPKNLSEILLRDVRDIFADSGAKVIGSSELAAQLAEMETRPWPEMADGREITPARVARLLAPFGIEPVAMRGGTRVFRGYRVTQFRDAFERYLGPGSKIR